MPESTQQWLSMDKCSNYEENDVFKIPLVCIFTQQQITKELFLTECVAELMNLDEGT